MMITPWFDIDVTPVRVGVYERKFGFGTVFSWWDGKYWRFGKPTPGLAAQVRGESLFQDAPWRGLLKYQS